MRSVRWGICLGSSILYSSVVGWVGVVVNLRSGLLGLALYDLYDWSRLILARGYLQTL